MILAAIAVVALKVFLVLCTETKTKFNRKASRQKHLAKPQFFQKYHHWPRMNRAGLLYLQKFTISNYYLITVLNSLIICLTVLTVLTVF